ncbi:Mitochondrial ATPase complex subunit atp10 [Lunasporangiospora selenospora]|uniref:Mitochondrial ATPase complex subunit atp10 n=1 Tax=Lunasporangiospora selenospora TaxID=979761 RepID=A0A9P6FMR3_9FUNG|nr:Mitochondrial ATPase complex subunit atp10 [Lunasporangiospora selenospora]
MHPSRSAFAAKSILAQAQTKTCVGPIQNCSSLWISKSHGIIRKPTGPCQEWCLLRQQSSPARTITTTSRLYQQQQPSQSQSTNTVAKKPSDTKHPNGDNSEADKAKKQAEAIKNLPLSPFGGRFGVVQQPLSTKQLAAKAGSNSKKSPFSKAKDGMKSKVHDWTDKEKNLEKRKELLYDFQSGYFREFTELQKTGSKLWKGTPSMIAADKSLYMPNIIGTSLKTSESVELVDLLKGKTSLVAISGTKFGEDHIETFMTPFLKHWPAAASQTSNVQLVELNIQENPLKAGLVRMMVPFVRKNIPEERHANYVLHYKSIKHLREPLSMQNSYLGYVFLVDSNCKIRWGANGNGTEAEIKTFMESVQKMSERASR